MRGGLLGKIIAISVALVLLIHMVAIGCCSLTYAQHSIIPKALEKTMGSIVHTFNFADGKVAIVNFGTNIQAFYLKQDRLGWHLKMQPGGALKDTQHYTDAFAFFHVNDSTLLYGYFPSPGSAIRLDDDFNSTMEFRRQFPANRTWFIPDNKMISSIKAEQLSVTLDNSQVITLSTDQKFASLYRVQGSNHCCLYRRSARNVLRVHVIWRANHVS